MRWLVDQGLPRSAAEILRKDGLDVVHTGECGMASAADRELVAMARREGRAIVTLDADFHAILALSGEAAPSVVRIRMEGLKGPELARLMRDIMSRCGDDLAAGSLVSVAEDRIRVRRLPIPPARRTPPRCRPDTT